MAEKSPLLRIRNLRTYFRIEEQWAKAVDGVSLDIFPGEVLGLVGESGSGKSVTALSILRLIPDPPGRIVDGEIWLNGTNLLALPLEEMYRIRGGRIAMIFQEPMTSLNPVFTIGMQVTETILAHERVSEAEARARAIELLRRVGIPDAEKRLNDYPHQFSGGMRQRVMIAMALACNPELLIADEPTTALDVTIQAQILELMLELQAQRGNGAILFITHDLAVVAQICQRVAVMYGGKIQEMAPTEELFLNPLHPYTRGLLECIPRPTAPGQKRRRLYAIPGNVPSILQLPQGCKFCTRCPVKLDICDTVEPPLVEVAPNHFVRCHLVSPMEGGLRYE
ncbi:MAG: ABC transporter ATP-binding protein [Candidatus Kapabacteria bacterium]|nr:ABC transporter ATP-binding protein [Candidatus Kapabacteria bacterium]MDW8012981.1 ABC transporter ATP-binding protein [Bacteroidota bacterium]